MATGSDGVIDVAAVIAAATAARIRWDHDAAEAILAEALRKAPTDASLLIEHGWTAFYRDDMAEAARRWLTVLLLHETHWAGWVGLCRSLVQLRKIDLAEAILRIAAARLPGNLDIAIGEAELASARQDWTRALQMWRALKAREAGSDRFDGRIGEAAWNLQFEEVDDPTIPPARQANIEAVDNPFARELLLKFESLGENCEFGLLQRRYGAEPLGLLRWNTTPPDTLLKMLAGGFAGLGDPETTTISVEPPGEYYIGDVTYDLHLHTFINQSSAESGEVLAKQCKRIRRMREIMLERLADGDRVFVYKSAQPDWPDIAERLHAALQRYGRNCLLAVQLADHDNPPGTVRRIRPGLMLGYLDRINPMQPGLPVAAWNISFTSWLDVSSEAHAIFERDFTRPAPQPVAARTQPSPSKAPRLSPAVASPPKIPSPPPGFALQSGGAWNLLRDAPAPAVQVAEKGPSLIGKLFGRR